MSLPPLTMTLSSFSFSEMHQLYISLLNHPCEGVLSVAFSQETEEYWPDKFASRYRIEITLCDDANISDIRDWIQAQS